MDLQSQVHEGRGPGVGHPQQWATQQHLFYEILFYFFICVLLGMDLERMEKRSESRRGRERITD